MVAWRYEISLLVLKKYFTHLLLSLVKYFSTLKRNFVSPRGHVISSIYHTLVTVYNKYGYFHTTPYCLWANMKTILDRASCSNIRTVILAQSKAAPPPPPPIFKVESHISDRCSPSGIVST